MTRKKKIIISVVCCAAALAITAVIYNPFKRRNPLYGRPIQMLCTECNHSFEITYGEYQKMLEKKGAIGPAGPIAPPPPLTCPNCGKDAAYGATKCEKCGHVFFINPAAAGDYQDRCPECGFSKAEERYKNR